VNDMFIYRNEGKLTYNDGATLRFTAPAEAHEISVRATAPGGMPVERPAVKDKDSYKVDFPIKPGETRFEISYHVPYSDGMTFAGKALYSSKIDTMLLAPQGVTLEGEGLVVKGQEPTTQATVYAVSTPAFQVKIGGQAAPAAETASSGPEIEQIMPKIMDRGFVILGLALGILALGFVLLYRKSQEGHGQRSRG